MSDSEFTINDRRIFTQEGEVRQEAKEEIKREETQSQAPQEAPSLNKAETAREEPDPHLPEANLTGLIIGLATSAFLNMGEAPQGEEPAPVNIPAAKHSIDLLAVLQKKTAGNLEEEEEALLQTLLYDLRLKFVSMTEQK